MNETGGLIRDSFVFLWRNPVVLLPVLVARVLDFAIYVLSATVARPLVRAVAPHSVLGGFTGAVTAPVVIVANLFALLPVACEVGLLIYAMVVSARWAHGIRESGPTAVRSWRYSPREIGRVGVLTFGVAAITTLVGVFLSLRGGVPLRWEYAVTWCFLMAASWFVLPAWLRLLARAEEVRFRDPAVLPVFAAVVLGFGAYALWMRLPLLLQRSSALSRAMHGVGASLAISLVVACLSVIPLTYAFVAMSRYVADRPGWRPE